MTWKRGKDHRQHWLSLLPVPLGLRMTLCPEETVRGSVDLTRDRFPKTRFAPVSRADLRLVALEVVPLALQRRAIGDVDGCKSRDISAPSCAR